MSHGKGGSIRPTAKMLREMVFITNDGIKAAVAASLSPARWRHTEAVAETAAALAVKHGADPSAAGLAGLLHDYARELPAAELMALAMRYDLDADPIEAREPLLLHGKVAAALARERFGLTDPALLAAIALHITGAPGMSLLAKLVFLADFIEPGRAFPEAVLARKAAEHDLAKSLLIAFEAIVSYVVAGGYELHPRTVAARNEILRDFRASCEPPTGTGIFSPQGRGGRGENKSHSI